MSRHGKIPINVISIIVDIEDMLSQLITFVSGNECDYAEYVSEDKVEKAILVLQKVQQHQKHGGGE